MRIFVHEKGGLPFCLVLPTGLLLNRFTASLAEKIVGSALAHKQQEAANSAHTAGKCAPDTDTAQKPAAEFSLQPGQMKKLIGVLVKMKKKYKKLELVNVKTASGTTVHISL